MRNGSAWMGGFLALAVGCTPVREIKYTSTYGSPSIPGTCRVVVEAVPDAQKALFPGRPDSGFDRKAILDSLRSAIEADLKANVFGAQANAVFDVKVQVLRLDLKGSRGEANLKVILLKDEGVVGEYAGEVLDTSGPDTIGYAPTFYGIAVMRAMAQVKKGIWSDQRKIEAVSAGLLTPAAFRPAGALVLNVAVAELRAEGLSSSDASVIGELVRGELVKTGAFKVVEKKNMEKIVEEQAFQQTGCTTQDCAVKLGKLLNVQRIIVGSCGNLLGKIFVNLRVVNVETGAAVFADEVSGKEVDDIQLGIRRVVRRMAAGSL